MTRLLTERIMQLGKKTIRAVAIIPARGGSKRLKNKNLRLLGGVPLAKRTLIETVNSECFDEIILSSDNPKILELSNEFELTTKHVREEALSGDHTTALDLVLNIVETKKLSKTYDVIALLLPTAPFRNKNHIQEGFKLLSNEVDGVVSLTTYEFPPQLSVNLSDGLIKPIFNPCPLIEGNTRSQDQGLIFRPNGGFYIQWMDRFLINRNFWRGKVKGYLMNRVQSVDIDDELDLEYANLIYDKGFLNDFS